MNMQELYRLESSYGIELLESSYGIGSADSDFQWNGPGHGPGHEGKEISSQLREQDAKEQVVTHHAKKQEQVSVSPATSTPEAKGKKADPSESPTLHKNTNGNLHSSQTTAKTKTKQSTKKKVNPFAKRKPSARTSTMPGFGDRKSSQRHHAFRDGLNIAKQSNDRMADKIHKVLHTEKVVKKRRKENSEAMYDGSACVPDSLVAFARELHMETRITPKEELELGTKTQEAIAIQKIHGELQHRLGRKPTANEWCEAAGKIDIEALEVALEDGMEAKDRLVTSNLRLVQSVVNLYIRNGLGSQYNAGDLMQEGVTALIRAAEKFDPERGFRFSTYAMYWIRSAVKRSQILQSRVINVPQRLHETYKKITKIETELKKELGRKPTTAELASAGGLTETQLHRCKRAIAQQCFSLDSELENTLNPNKSDMNHDTMYNILAAQYDNVEFKQLKSDFMKDDLISTLYRYLSSHEVDLLLLRYGLMDERTLPHGFSGPLTIAEVSRLVGLKPDKVRRMINKSLRQLRHLIAHEWEDFEKVLS